MANPTLEWLLNSGIQNIGKDKKINGGFNSWYDIDNKSYPFVYSEITGYGITTLLFMNSESKNSVLVERAKLAAGWLISNALDKCGGFKTRYFHDDGSFRNKEIYIFDTGMILYGLANLFKATKDSNCLEACKNAANFLIRCQKKDGLFYAIYDSEKSNLVDTEGKWSTQSGSYHAKVAMSLADMHEITNDNSYKDAAIKICDAALKLQKEEGRFVSLKESGDTHLHPHSYSAEGLLYVGTKFNIDKYVAAAIRACKWSLGIQMSNGGIPYYYKNSGEPIQYERVDVTAQTLRLGCLLRSMNKLDKKYDDKLAKLRDRLCEFQIKEGATTQRGAFLFGTDYDGKARNHANSWCSMFALQALNMYESVYKIKKKASVDLLI